MWSFISRIHGHWLVCHAIRLWSTVKDGIPMVVVLSQVNPIWRAYLHQPVARPARTLPLIREHSALTSQVLYRSVVGHWSGEWHCPAQPIFWSGSSVPRGQPKSGWVMAWQLALGESWQRSIWPRTIPSIHHQVCLSLSSLWFAGNMLLHLVTGALPIIRVIEGRQAIIQIPAADWDVTDDIRCRWASATGAAGNECGDVCNNLPGAVLSPR